MKTQITQAAFDKKVDTEFAYLTHVDGLTPEKARREAEETVAEKFEVKKDD